MRDPKKQAQERKEFLYCDTDSIITTERSWRKSREVKEMSVYAEYIRQCVNEWSTT